MSETEPWLQYQQLIISFLERQDEKLEDLNKQIASNTGDRRIQSENIAIMKEDIYILKQIIRDGNESSPSVLKRLSVLEYDIKTIVDDYKAKIDEEKTNKGHNRALFLVLIGFVLSAVWNIVQYFWM